ncbi:hypothetical protein Droror1_Dr00003233 [Drosera rotundifolia]
MNVTKLNNHTSKTSATMASVESNISEKSPTKKHVAIIFGSTGLAGRELITRLIMRSWKVYGVARKPNRFAPREDSVDFQFISCDLLDPMDTEAKLSPLEDVTHMYWITWANQYPLNTRECCDQNKAMLSNALNAILPRAKALEHVSLQTGTKHYVSISAYLLTSIRRLLMMSDVKRVYTEESPRAFGTNNFYYALEDLLKERLDRRVGWSVQRPGLIVGVSERSWFNFIGGLSVYGTICKRLNLPFVFGGTKSCWNEPYVIDISDARLVAEQHIWASTDSEISSRYGEAFNCINGPEFKWSEIWSDIARKFDIEESMFSEEFKYKNEMADHGQLWQEIIKENGLKLTKLDDLASWDFLDMLFRCPLSLQVTREKADRFGFTMRYTVLESILYWIDQMREQKLIA